jgi:hypothetical protein
MTDDRWKDFFDKMAGTGLVNPRTNYKRAYTLEFVDKPSGSISGRSSRAAGAIAFVLVTRLTMLPTDRTGSLGSQSGSNAIVLRRSRSQMIVP